MPVEKSTHNETRLSGTQKAAALLLVMGKDTAIKLAHYVSPKEIEGFVKAASSLKTLEAETIDDLVKEFQGNFTKMGMLADADDLSDFFKPSGPEEEREEEQKETPGERVGAVPSLEQIGEFLATEPDYMSVFLLSTLGDELLAEVLSTLDAERRKSLFKLYLDREPTAPMIEADMREALFRFSEIPGLTRETRSIIFDGIEPDVIVRKENNRHARKGQCAVRA